MRAARRTPPGGSPLPFLVVGGVALVSLGWGAWLVFGPHEAPGGSPVVEPPAPTAAVPARGTGVWENAAPPSTTTAAGGALCSGCDVVVVTVCSLRRDHTGPYAERSLTPALDALTAGAFRMDQAWSASNFTLASLTAVLTGRFGSATGVTGWDKGLVADVPTLPEVLGLYGYRTGGFTTDAPSGFRPDYGLDRGFQHLEIIPPPRDNPDGRNQPGPIGPGGAAALPAAAWIREQPHDAPIFVLFHTRTAHYPFVVEDDPTDTTGVTTLLWEADRATVGGGKALPGTAGGTAQRGVVTAAQDPVQAGVRAAGEAGVAVWRRRYAEAVGRLDRDFAEIGEALGDRGNLDRTVLVVLADHGESLDDHGELLHGDAYYDGVVHIPMLVRVPGLEGRPIPALVSQVDLLPTVTELVGAVPPAGIDGASMLPLLTGATDAIRSTTFVEGGVAWRDDGQPRGAVVKPPWTLLLQDRGCDGGPPTRPGEPRPCLYDLEKDPGQTRDVAAENPAIVDDLLRRWELYRAATGRDGKTLDLAPELVEELRKTGYDFRKDTP